MTQKQRHIAFYILYFLVISIPFPDYSLTSKAIILWAGYVLWTGRHQLLSVIRKNFPLLLALSALWFLQLAGLIYSDNPAGGMITLQRSLPLIILPLTFFVYQPGKNDIFRLFDGFSFAVTGAFAWAWLQSIYFKWQQWGDFIYYKEISFFLNKHTTYFALFAAVMLLYLIYLFWFYPSRFKKYHILLLVAGLAILFLLQNRIVWLALVAGIQVLISRRFASASRKITTASAVLWLTAFLALALVYHFRQPQTGEGGKHINDTAYRFKHWQAVVETGKTHLLFGTGTGGSRADLYRRYRQYRLRSAYNEHYNAHNQFLEVLLDFGLVGLILLIVSLWVVLNKCRRKKELPALCFSLLITMLIFMLTESTLVRFSGIVSFALWIGLLLSVQDEK